MNAMAQQVIDGAHDGMQDFEFGLSLILDGLDKRGNRGHGREQPGDRGSMRRRHIGYRARNAQSSILAWTWLLASAIPGSISFEGRSPVRGRA
jgi:hypothetical protein